MIDTAARSVVATIDVGDIPIGVVVSPDGSRVYVANAGDGTVSVIDVASRQVIDQTLPLSTQPTRVALSGDGSLLYVTHNGGVVSVIDTETMTLLGEPIPVGEHPGDVAVSPNSTHIYVTNTDDSTVSVISLLPDVAIAV